ncbi:prepilin peptidase [Hydrogenophaga sp.]|uniref:prepilin peptidase n=1 Tax=Hydrogenophaga sp. TaxID=1904254 RepID=UPI003568A573
MLIASALFLLCVAAFDIARRKMPNTALILGGAAATLLLSTHTHPLQLSWLAAGVGLLVGAVLYLPFYLSRLMAAGDVKLGCLLGYSLGAEALLQVFLLANVLALGHSLVLLALKRRKAAALAPAGLAPARAHNGKPQKIPLAGYMAIATLAAMVMQAQG